MNSNFSSEQRIAIASNSGALISAGAGSGKTAVLVEHLITWIESSTGFKQAQEELLINDLKNLVVVTFTVKASMEMRMRLSEKIEEKKTKQWDVVLKNLHRIYIGTIDGFCANLLQSHKDLLLTDVPIEIVSEQEWQLKIQDLFWQWHKYETNLASKQLAEVWSKRIILWLQKIISSAPQRIFWNKLPLNLSQELYETTNKECFWQLALKLGWLEIKNQTLDLFSQLDSNDYQDKKWFLYLKTIVSLMQSGENVEALIQLLLFNRETKVVMGPRTDDLKLINQCIKDLRNIFSKLFVVYSDWDKSLKCDGVNTWQDFYKVAKTALNYIETNYTKVKGFCFGDLTYYALQLLNNKTIPSKGMPYVVIDELQDTSNLQLELLLLYVKNDTTRLYGVGDIKQAIYGFRGGESHVFFKFLKLVKNRVDLFENYRSVQDVVDFNNKIFSQLFDQTRSLPQLSKAQIEAVPEVVPVEILKWEINPEEKIEEWQQEILEYHALILKIKKISELDPEGTISVLFRTNNQIKRFSSMLSQEEITFSVQWKIKFKEDPLFQIFQDLLLISKIRKEKKDSLHLEKILSFHYHEIGGNVHLDIAQFQEEWVMFDVFTTYCRWLNSHNLVIAYQAPFLSLLHNHSKLTSSTNFKDHLMWLEEIKDDETLAYWTLPESNNSKKTLVLQTIHASKGLQYDHVLMSRISAKQRGNASENIILDLENQFAFKEVTYLRNPWKNPAWYKTYEEKKSLQEEESIRLFYVACTRARKSLTMSLAASTNSDSWAELIHQSENTSAKYVFLPLDEKSKEILRQETKLLPIFEAQIYTKWKKHFIKNQNINFLKILPSQSVSTLLDYEKCPMKYYFSHVLELDRDEITQTKKHSKSSAKRGSNVHLMMQNYFSGTTSFEQTQRQLDGDAKSMFTNHGQKWFEEIKDAELLKVEEEIRFVWKDLIILGTPDLYFKKYNLGVVWDFKTGVLDVEDIKIYFLQLKWYAFALYQKGNFPSQLSLKIVALDDQVTHEISMDILEITKELDLWWQGFTTYHTKKLSHCPKCSYQLYCNKNS